MQKKQELNFGLRSPLIIQPWGKSKLTKYFFDTTFHKPTTFVDLDNLPKLLEID